MSAIQIDRAGAITTLWLAREAKRNALDGDLMRAFGPALDAVAEDPACRVLVIRGKGPVFSSGIDHSLLVEVFQASQRAPFLHLLHQLQDNFHRMARLQKPVIVAMHGVCVGMALELALAADIRIATADCVMGLPEIAFGLVPDVGGTTRLIRAVGESRARELILTGRLVKAKTAVGYGLVHDAVADADALDKLVSARAEALAAHPPIAMGLAKTLCGLSADTSAAASFRIEGVVQQTLLGQPDLAMQLAKAVAFIKAQIAAAE